MYVHMRSAIPPDALTLRIRSNSSWISSPKSLDTLTGALDTLTRHARYANLSDTLKHLLYRARYAYLN